MNNFIFIVLVLLLLLGSAQGQTILTWSNDVTNNVALKPMVSEGQSITFDVSTVDVDIHHWYRNGIDQGHDFDNYTTSWASWGDTAEVIYIGEAAGGAMTDNLTWEPVIVVVRATSTAIPVDTTRSDEFINATDDMGIEKMLAAEMYMFTDKMGVLFFLFIIGIPMVMVYIRTESLLVPGVLGVISGGFLVSFMPTAYQVPAILLIVISVAGIIMSLFKERTS